MPGVFSNHRRRAAALFRTAAAAAATLSAGGLASAATVNGTVAPSEYATTLATQSTPTHFGDNLSELNRALANYVPGGNLELALTGNLETIGSGLILFIDSRPGGGVANTIGTGFNQFGSISGQRVEEWGSDTNAGVGVTAPAGGASVLAPGFNPDYALEIHNTGGASYFINVIDLSLPNTPASNRDIPLGSTALNSGAAVTHTYIRRDALGNPIDSGDVTSSFDNTNTAGVTDTSAAGAATATKGIELLLESQFLAQSPGHAVRILPFITNSDGTFLSNQFLPGLGAGAGTPGAANDPAGTPLFDARNFSDRLYLDVFVPTMTSNGDWLSGASWSGGAAPNGAEHAARIAGNAAQPVNLGPSGVTVGFLELSNAAGATIGGAGGGGGGTLNFNAGAGVAATFVTAGNHTMNAAVNVQSDWRVSVAAGSSLSTAGMNASANRQITKVGDGALTIGGAMMLNGAGVKVDVQRGTLAVNADLGNALNAATTAPQVTVGLSAGGSPAVVNFGASQTLKSLSVNAGGVVNVLQGGARAIVANALALAGTGKLDLADNNMVLKAVPAGASVGGVYDGVQGEVQRAYNFGGWDGNGLTTSMPDATGGITTLGVATGEQIRGLGASDTDVWNGITIRGSDTVVMYTYAGDANLDGQVDAGDYGILDAFIQIEGAAGYGNGDFNYDGFIDPADYGTIDNTIQFQGPPLGDAATVAAVTAVPEPAACAFASAAAAVALLRRRRRVARSAFRREQPLCQLSRRAASRIIRGPG